MKIVNIKTELLTPNARNSRTHSGEQIEQIAASIKSFGWTNPILVKPDNTIIAGHGRLLAAQKIGMDEVPCIILDGLSDDKCRALLIADNKLALNAGWDVEMLVAELQELESLGFDLDSIGFTDDELDDLAQSLASVDLSTGNEEPIDSIGVSIAGVLTMKIGKVHIPLSQDEHDKFIERLDEHIVMHGVPYGFIGGLLAS